MAVLEILKYPASALRRKCLPVERVTERIEELARAMLDTLHDAPGVGLAAPQVGENVRLIVVDVSLGKDLKQVYFLINPEIESAEGEHLGCERLALLLCFFLRSLLACFVEMERKMSAIDQFENELFQRSELSFGRWHAVDLHNHSPASPDFRGNRNTALDETVQHLEETSVEIVMFTDHEQLPKRSFTDEVAKRSGKTILRGTELKHICGCVG